jgi:hypothetical protein
VDFTRLECREILAHLDPDCDPDVITKLQEAAQSTAVARPRDAAPAEIHRHSDVPTPAETYQRLQEHRADRAEVAAAQKTFPYTFNRAAFRHLDDEQFAAHVAIQRQLWERDQVASKEIPMEALNPPQQMRGFGSGIQRLPLGARNAAGDVCVAVDPDSGVSTFTCKACGDTYVANNPAVRGCKCGGSGSGELAEYEEPETPAAVAAVRADKGAIAGEDSNW